ncbi:MAG: Elongation factor 4 [Candidatus Roizmanbacteria bacterium GW2011_GWA2_37_7]|uniref:Elongation factor 4 n=1 Tax=Candidatus Roizmanbacteria bacterium GW2011_GWA2_37_7 TaxID=1618481 RepID=A0A0G0HJ69_9BACT|nr:MAG: Elongation factor 4 [Candidatus Roizmanbacteria bacterium GW2011_GWA2_37_7]
MKQIRNFAIIAHIDHGKSTLADRLMEMTGTIDKNKHDEQMLDRNPISRERGITIKLAPVRMEYQFVILNLIDTPGHVDFSYEVDRTLAVVNKIDMLNAEVEKTVSALSQFLGIHEDEVIRISAKTGENVQYVLDAIIQRLPSPHILQEYEHDAHLKALIFDSYFDTHKGVIAFVRIFEGHAQSGQKMKLAVGNRMFETTEVGYFTPDLVHKPMISEGEIGYIVTNLKDIRDVRVGDSIIDQNMHTGVPGYKKVKPVVFASLFPTDTADYEHVKNALEKIYLTDSALEFIPIYSQALGAGFRIGFLGLLHADVICERLEREYNLSLVLTPPQVNYQIQGEIIKEPIVKIMIITPQKYIGGIMRLCEDHRALFLHMDNKNQVSLEYEMPLAEMISNFFDQLKSVSSGYASFDWVLIRYDVVDASRLSLLLNGDEIEEFSQIVVHERAQQIAMDLTKKLKDLIPRQQYEVRIQAQYKGRIIASERLSPFRKDVLMKGGKSVGGGDVNRKRKVLEKQKEGKKRMKMIGKVEVPKEVFTKLFKNG